MRCFKYKSLILFVFLPLCVYATSQQLHKQSHQTIKINSHGILTDRDYPDDNFSKEPYNIKKKPESDYIFWQCFPREDLTVELSDNGNPAVEYDRDETYSLISISVRDANGVDHEFVPRRAWPTDSNITRFQTWYALMKKEKYVCIAGRSATLMNDEQHKGKNKLVVWYWEMLKTKKGCNSYFPNMCQSKKLLKKKTTG